MKNVGTLLLCLASLLACRRGDVTPREPQDPDPIRLTIPAGGQVLSVTGNLDSTLYVSSTFTVYKTTDRGRSWQPIIARNSGPLGVYSRKDTVFLTQSVVTTGTERYLINVTNYSIDAGASWLTDNRLRADRGNVRTDLVKASGGVAYAEKGNTTGSYVNPSAIIRRSSGGSGPLRFPYKHVINQLYLDAQNRLYVAVRGRHLPETNRIWCCDQNEVGYVYVSRRALP